MVATQKKACVLVVEDDPDLRDTLAEILEQAGYRVVPAGNGREALAQLQGELPGMILLDLMMPVMNGWEFRERQRQDPRLAAIPVAVLTGVRNSGDQVTALDAVEYLQKPIDLPSLLATVARHCGG